MQARTHDNDERASEIPGRDVKVETSRERGNNLTHQCEEAKQDRQLNSKPSACRTFRTYSASIVARRGTIERGVKVSFSGGITESSQARGGGDPERVVRHPPDSLDPRPILEVLREVRLRKSEEHHGAPH